MAQRNGESLLGEVKTSADRIIAVVEVSLFELHLTARKLRRD
jgi:hypothetical protein